MGNHLMYDKCKNENKDCFACKDGVCIILTETNFLNKNGTSTRRPCPFYKKVPIGKDERL